MNKKNQTYFIRTFGCQMNEADSERIAATLEDKGCQQAKDIKEADLVIINSCIVRESAENRAYGLINNIQKRHPELDSGSHSSIPKQVRNDKQQIVLTGCLAGWALRNERTNLNKLRKRIGDEVDIKLIEDIANFEVKPKHKSDQHAYIPISNGCNHFCSYCIVPYARGRETYRSAEEITNDVYCALKQGYSQIMLLGQNVNTWKSQTTSEVSEDFTSEVNNLSNFAELLEVVAKIEGVEEVTFMSANPRDFSDQLITVIAENKNVSREIHLPVQSGDNRLLKAMNRGYSREDYLKLVKKLKKNIPEVEITTDLLVGFPGETKKAFENTLDLCKQVKFKRAFINKYSPRPGTAAAENYQDSVPHPVKKKRWSILEKLINKSD